MKILLYVKAKKIFEINQAQIWLLLEQITSNLAFYFKSFSVICLITN